jgi:hypothetical protein
MRGRFHVFIMVAFLALAPGTALAQPAAAEEAACGAPAHPNWTAQEKFAWARICGDEVADLTKEPGYGGPIDPRAGQLPDNRVLSKHFIETILTEEKYRRALKRHGVRITGARFKEHFDLQNIKLEVELWFEQCQFDDGVDLSYLQSSQPVAFNRSKVTKSLNFYSVQLVPDLWVSDSVVDAVSMVGAHVGRTLNLSKSKIGTSDEDSLNLSGIDIGTDLLMEGGDFRIVSLSGARVGHTLSMANSRFAAQIDLRYSQISGELDFRGAAFMDDVDLTGARVGGAFLLGRPAVSNERCDREASPPQSQRGTCWAAVPNDEAALIARYSHIGIIPRLSDAWPRDLRIVGLTYDGIAYDVSGDPDDEIANVHNDFKGWFARQGNSRQPYEQLANVLQARGEIETATAVRYAEREHDRVRAWHDNRLDIYGWLTLLKGVIGYGYYPYRSIWWVFGFVFLGVVVLRASGEGPRNHMPIGVSYSFDMLLPIVRLRDQHYDVDLQSWPRYYFYFHKIVGWALASFLVAGLSGLTK